MSYLFISFMLLNSAQSPQIETIGYNNGLPYLFEAQSLFGKDLRGNSLILQKDAAAAWFKMKYAAEQDKVILSLNYAFRDKRTQRRVRRDTPGYAAKVGFSSHQEGIAIDVANVRKAGKKTRVYYWLRRHASEYDFYRTEKNEPWHWEWQSGRLGGKQ